MKKMLCSLLAIVLLCGCQSNLDEGKEMSFPYENENIRIPIFTSTYQYIDRELSVEDFSFIEKGTTLQEVTDKLGEPNGTSGTGLLKYFYHLEDDSAVELFIGENEEIWSVMHTSIGENDEGIQSMLVE